ncbi:MAG: aa3-type cytochrome oxidase subunit CtaJ [Acidothermaceae bacterium]
MTGRRYNNYEARQNVIPRRTPRLVAHTAIALAVLSGSLLAMAGPALAIGERGDPGGRLSWVQTVLIFVGIPVAAAAVITFLVCLPSMVKGPRYRPGRPWTAGSVWFGGPVDQTDLSGVTSTDIDSVEGGGASAHW